MERLPDGSPHLRELVPQATRETLRSRLAELDALPVAWVLDPEEGPADWRVVTPDLRVRLSDERAVALATALGLRIKSRPSYAPGWVVLTAADALAAVEVLPAIRALAGVAAADVLLAKQRFLRTLPNDPLIGQQWHLVTSGSASPGTSLEVESVWDYAGGTGIRGRGVRIGVVDDGLQQSHPDLSPNVDASLGWDWNGNDSNPSPTSGNRHGTACAGNAAARGNNAQGGSGVAPEATLAGLRLVAAPATDQQEAEAFVWKQDAIQVKSNSWGPDDTGRILEEPGPLAKAALQSATTNGRNGLGTIFVWAAGNGGDLADNSNYDGYANSIHTIAVGAIDSSGNSSYYSERGANLVVCAPSDGSTSTLGITTTDLVGSSGYNTASTAAGGDYAHDFGGTSSATPLVAGVVALMLEKNPGLGWRDVQEILMRSAKRILPSDPEWIQNAAGFWFHHRMGAGLANAPAAVAMAEGWTNLPPQDSVSQSISTVRQIPENNATGIMENFVFPANTMRAEHVTVTVDISHTSRGNLEIVLTSPSGTASRLAEIHSDTNDNFTQWTFSTVRNWGESITGTWSLRISDISPAGNTSGGTLNSATLKIYGSSATPVNPPPTVAIVSPADQSVFTPGSAVDVEVAASDLNADGSAGSVVSVELLDNGVAVGSAASPPYRFQLHPSAGNHQIVARATDAEGVVGDSAPVGILMENRPPAIASVTLDATDKAYADEGLRVSDVVASDQDADPLTISYQWQSSADGLAYADVAGETGQALAGGANQAGACWRCRVTVSDGPHLSAPVTSAAVNLLSRPLGLVKAGSAYSYQSGLVLAGDPISVTKPAILNEFSQGPAGGSSEWVEILVLKNSDLGFWDLSNSTSQLVFKKAAVWSSIPAGTVIVIYNGTAAKDPLLPADDLDPSDGRMVVSSTNAAYFDAAFGTWIPLANSGGSILLNDAVSARIHGLSYGTGTGSTLNVGAVGSGTAAKFTGSTETTASQAGGWQVVSSTGPVTPGQGNNAANSAFVSSLRSGNSRLPAPFRLASNSTLPAGLSLDLVSGLISGTVSTDSLGGVFRVGIERFNSAGDVAATEYFLTVEPLTGYERWLTGFSGLAETGELADPEGDGRANLVEFAAGSSPLLTDPPFLVKTDATGISIDFVRDISRTDVALNPEWSSGLGPEGWSTQGLALQTLSTNGSLETVRATLPFAPGRSAAFLRLRASRVP